MADCWLSFLSKYTNDRRIAIIQGPRAVVPSHDLSVIILFQGLIFIPISSYTITFTVIYWLSWFKIDPFSTGLHSLHIGLAFTKQALMRLVIQKQ